MDALWHLVVIALGICSSAFFSGIETGLISLNRVRLRHQVERKNRRAIIISGFVENTERLLGTTLFGNNLANVVVAVSASSLAAQLFGNSYWVGLVATVVAAVLLLILGEIVPKTLFRHYSFRMCLGFADVLVAVAWLFAPLVALLGVVMRLISRAGRGEEQARSFFVTREELKLLAKEGEAEGALTTEERQMIHGVFDFPHKTVFDVMVTLSRTVTVAPDTSVAELRTISQRTGFARFPVREGNQLLGIVNVYELLFDAAVADADEVQRYIRPSPVVYSTERIDRVLPRLRVSRNPISLVVNPEGQHVGIITIEDIVEEIVGEVEG